MINSNAIKAMAKRINKKANGDACASPHLEKIAPLLHSSTNRQVEAAASADSLEIENMKSTCHQAKKPTQPKLKFNGFLDGYGQPNDRLSPPQHPVVIRRRTPRCG
jgi:hypothetical protein